MAKSAVHLFCDRKFAVEKFAVEKFMVEKFMVELWSKILLWNCLQNRGSPLQK